MDIIEIMRWLRGMLDEVKIAAKMTYNRSFFDMKPNWAWLADRHLRNGYFISLPIFLVPMAWFLVSGLFFDSFGLLFILALASSIVWFTYSSWSRQREKAGS